MLRYKTLSQYWYWHFGKKKYWYWYWVLTSSTLEYWYWYWVLILALWKYWYWYWPSTNWYCWPLIPISTEFTLCFGVHMRTFRSYQNFCQLSSWTFGPAKPYLLLRGFLWWDSVSLCFECISITRLSDFFRQPQTCLFPKTLSHLLDSPPSLLMCRVEQVASRLMKGAVRQIACHFPHIHSSTFHFWKEEYPRQGDLKKIDDEKKGWNISSFLRCCSCYLIAFFMTKLLDEMESQYYIKVGQVNRNEFRLSLVTGPEYALGPRSPRPKMGPHCKAEIIVALISVLFQVSTCISKVT